MDVDEEGTDDDEREILIKLIPSVVETMKNHGQLETWIQFNQLLVVEVVPYHRTTARNSRKAILSIGNDCVDNS
jgi:hypothetical protein